MNMKWLLIEIAETVEELKAIMHSQAKGRWCIIQIIYMILEENLKIEPNKNIKLNHIHR